MASYQKSANGNWTVRFRTYEDNSIIQKRLSGFKTKKEAEAAYMAFAATHKNDLKPVKELSFEALFYEYVNYQKVLLKETSVYDINIIAKKHILPYFGKKQARSIKKADIIKWQTEISENNFSYNYLCKIRNILSAIFEYGVQAHDLTNPVKQTRTFRNREMKKEMQFWTKEEFDAFIACADDITYKTFFTFLFMTGCRKGEALALKWEDINWKNQTAKISKTLVRKFDFEKHPDANYLLTSPKNQTSNRTIDLATSLVNLLKIYKAEKGYTENQFVFAGDMPLKQTTTTRRLAEYCKKADVKQIRLHDFRHSHASLLIGKGVDIVSVAKRLGHSDIEQTLNTYSHFLPENSVKIKDAIEF